MKRRTFRIRKDVESNRYVLAERVWGIYVKCTTHKTWEEAKDLVHSICKECGITHIKLTILDIDDANKITDAMET